jgi:TonB family protein
MTTAALSLPDEEGADRARWFWIFVAVSLAAHVAFLLHARWERHNAGDDSVPAVMAVQMVEVLPAPPKPVVVPAPGPETVTVKEPAPVMTRLPEPVAAPAPVRSRSATKPAMPKVQSASAASSKAAPALVEARPSARGNRPPYYPEMARRNGWQGLCMVRVSVTPEGRAASVSLARSSGHGILDQAALAAVRKWKFSPRMVRGNAVACTVEVPVNFSLR